MVSETASSRRPRWRSLADASLGGTLLTSGFTQLVVIVSGVLVARSLGPEDRGYFALLTVVSGICYLLASLGLPTAATYFIARDRVRAREIAGALLWPVITLAIAGLVLQIVFLGLLVTDDPEQVKVAAAVSLLLVPAIFAFGLATSIFQGQGHFGRFNVFRTLPTLTYVLAVVALFVGGSASLVTIMVAWAGANFVCGFLALGVAGFALPKPTLTTADPLPSRQQMTKFGLKSLVGSMSPIDAFRLDQIVVGLFLAPVALGMYVAAQALSGLTRIVAWSVGLVAYPRVASQADRGAARRTMWKYFLLGVAVSSCVVVLLEVTAGRLVPLFFGSDFEDAVGITRILVLASLFMAARRVLTDGVNGLGHPGLGTIAEVASWIVLVPAVATCLPLFGVKGVALALLISWLSSFVLMLVLVLRADTRAARAQTHPMAWTWPSLTRHHLVAAALAVAASATAGLAVANVGPRTSLIMTLAIVVVLLFAYGRSAIRPATVSARLRMRSAQILPVGGERASPRRSNGAFRLPRALYYLGVLALGLLTFRAGGQITFSDVLFLFSALVASAELAVARRPVPLRLPLLLTLGLIVFSLGGLLSTFDSLAPLQSVAVIVRLVVLTLVWFWLGTIVLERQAHVTTAIRLWVASAAVCGSAAVLQTLGANIPHAGTISDRATGFTTHPNDLGGLTCIAFVPALMLATAPRASFSTRVLSYVCLILVGAGLILSGSVGALAAAIAAVLVWLALERSTIRSLAAYAAIALCVIAVVTIQATRGALNPLERFKTTTSAQSATRGSGSLEDRVVVYRVAKAEIEDHPFIGVGLDLPSITRPFGEVSYAYDVHNLFVGIWYKAGLLGLAGMLMMVAAILMSSWAAVRRSGSETERTLGVALLASAVAFLTFAMSEPLIYSRYGWIAVALIFALRATQARDARIAQPKPFPAEVRGLAPVGT